MIPGAAAAATKFSAASHTAGDKVMYAKYFEGATEDGALKEAAWQLNSILVDGVKFGALWNSENLYLGFDVTVVP